MIRYIFLLLTITPLYLDAQNSLQFFGEKIDFSIDQKRFSVNGIYYFSNNTGKATRKSILFPFPKDSDSLTVKRIYNLTYKESIDYQKSEDAVAFQIMVLPGDTVKLNMAYSLNTEKENVYILESTKTWGQGLKWADYSLTFDHSVQVDSLSLKPDSITHDVFYWNKKNFYPENNFKVWIK